MDAHLIAYYIGILIVFGTHIYILTSVSDEKMKMHAYINIFGAMLVAYYFMHKEQFIQF
jgi:hypothetical protein